MAKKAKQLSIEFIALTQLVPWPSNPRIHDDLGVSAIADSITRNGWTSPIIAQRGSNRILAGHGRRLAALSLGMTEVPVIFVDLDEVNSSAYTITDNATTERSSWDMDLLRRELAELQGLGFDLNSIGFSESWMQSMLPHVEAVEGREFDESIADGVTLDVTFKLKVPLADAENFEEALDAFLADHPNVRKEKVV